MFRIPTLKEAQELAQKYDGFFSKKEIIDGVEFEIFNYINKALSDLENIKKEAQNYSRKDFAIKYKKHELFPAIMAVYCGQDTKTAFFNYFRKKYNKESKVIEFFKQLEKGDNNV